MVNDMVVYIKENSPKKIYIDESKINLLIERFDENYADEGGVYNINNIRKGRGKGLPTYMDSDYQYTNDNGEDGVYADFTPYGKKKGYLNPLNPNWIQVRNNMPYSAQKSQRYPQISDADMPNYMPKSDDDFIRHNGILYMPTKHRIMNGKGDVIKNKLEPDNVYVGLDGNNKKMFVKCYNLTMLGQGGENARKLATMIAHTYKEKDCGYGEQHKAFKLRNRGNLIVGEWKEKVTQLINNTPDLINFNPTYIIYPQSSSKFNDYIAEYMKTIFPNAQLLPKDLLQKMDMWEFDYDDLIYHTIDWAKNGDNMTKYKDVYSKYKELNDDYIKETLLRRLVAILSNKIARKLYKMYTDNDFNGTSFSQEHFNGLFKKKLKRKMNEKEMFRASLLDRIWAFIMDDLENIERSITTSGLFKTPKEISNYRELLTILTFQALFKKEDVGHFSGEYFGRNAKDRTENFKNLEAIELSFIRGDIVINTEGIKNIALSNDTIKNYDNPSRLALKGQFEFNKNYDLSTIKPNDKFIVIDDNYASGASIRNAARVIAQLGVPLYNIIGLTPGDMGGASSGGKRGADVPENSGEGWLAYNYSVNNAYKNIPSDVQQLLKNKYMQLSGNQSHIMQNRTRSHQSNQLGQKFIDYEAPTEVPIINRGSYGVRGRKPYSDEERASIIQSLNGMKDEFIGYRNMAKQKMKAANNRKELDYWTQKYAEYCQKLVQIRSRINGLEKHRAMTQGAKERAAMRRKNKTV